MVPAWAEHNFIEQEPVVRHISNRARLGKGAHGHPIQLDMGGYATAGEAGKQTAFSKKFGMTFCLLYAQSASVCGFKHKMPKNPSMRQSCSFEKLRKMEYERVN